MPQWATFAGLTVLCVILFLSLARLSQSTVSEIDAPESNDFPSITDNGVPDRSQEGSAVLGSRRVRPYSSARNNGTANNGLESSDRSGSTADSLSNPTAPPWRADDRAESDGTLPPRSAPIDASRGSQSSASIEPLSTGALLFNVAFSQGLFGGIVLLGAWYAEVPFAALGIDAIGFEAVSIGVALGLFVYVGNELATVGAEALGYAVPEALRSTLAPDSTGGWVVLFVLILPAVAFVEELLFRAALIGAISAGFAISPWPLVVVSSIAFGFGHGAQGSVGMVITGLLGFVLAAAFVLTGSLLVVVVAHYLVNAAEFAVREGIGIERSPFA